MKHSRVAACSEGVPKKNTPGFLRLGLVQGLVRTRNAVLGSCLLEGMSVEHDKHSYTVRNSLLPPPSSRACSDTAAQR